MVFVDGLAFIDAAEYVLWNVELREADQGLTKYQDIRNETHDAVGVCEPRLWVTCFVHLDDY